MVLLIGLLVFVDFGYVLFDASFFELKFANWAFRFCRVFLGDCYFEAFLLVVVFFAFSVLELLGCTLLMLLLFV
jgi:hypothetical protein